MIPPLPSTTLAEGRSKAQRGPAGRAYARACAGMAEAIAAPATSMESTRSTMHASATTAVKTTRDAKYVVLDVAKVVQSSHTVGSRSPSPVYSLSKPTKESQHAPYRSTTAAMKWLLTAPAKGAYLATFLDARSSAATPAASAAEGTAERAAPALGSAIAVSMNRWRPTAYLLTPTMSARS